MKRLLPLFIALGAATAVPAQDLPQSLTAHTQAETEVSSTPTVPETEVLALRTADARRLAATIAADVQQLAAIYSEELRYAHSNGLVDTKASMLESLGSGQTKYSNLEYRERNWSFPAPGVALMTGRVQVKLEIKGAAADVLLGYLAVWRKEAGQWQFLAWQSCRLPATERTVQQAK